MLYHMVQRGDKLLVKKKPADRDDLLERSLAAFVEAGTLDLSLDQLAKKVGSSKRMLIHYFGSREALEEAVMARLENRLRARFSAEAFRAGTPLRKVVAALWEESTRQQSRGVLQLVMDVNRRGWSGSECGKAFYREQQQQWVDLLRRYLPNQKDVEMLLQLFQGAVLAYLMTGDSEQGRRALERFTKGK